MNLPEETYYLNCPDRGLEADQPDEALLSDRSLIIILTLVVAVASVLSFLAVWRPGGW